MMLQIDHRESRDVDIFLPDPQLLPFLDPQRHDFTFEILPGDYGGDGTGFLKFVFDNVGEGVMPKRRGGHAAFLALPGLDPGIAGRGRHGTTEDRNSAR
jgi:hypothetical protein